MFFNSKPEAFILLHTENNPKFSLIFEFFYPTIGGEQFYDDMMGCSAARHPGNRGGIQVSRNVIPGGIPS